MVPGMVVVAPHSGWVGGYGWGKAQGRDSSSQASSGTIRSQQDLCILNDLSSQVAFLTTQSSHTEFPVSHQFTSSIQETGPQSPRECPQQQHGGSLDRDHKQRAPSGGPALASAAGSGACRDPCSLPWPPPAHAAVSARSPGATLRFPATSRDHARTPRSQHAHTHTQADNLCLPNGLTCPVIVSAVRAGFSSVLLFLYHFLGH